MPRRPSTPAQIRDFCRRAWRDPAFRASVYWTSAALTAHCWRDYRQHRIEAARTAIAQRTPHLDQFNAATRQLQQQVRQATTHGAPPPDGPQQQQSGVPQPERPNREESIARLAAHHRAADHLLGAVERRWRQRWAWDDVVDRHFWPKGLWDEFNGKVGHFVGGQKELRRLYKGMDARERSKEMMKVEEGSGRAEKPEGRDKT